MTNLQLFAFVILPVVVVLGAAFALFMERRTWRVAASEPDLFSPRPRSAPNSEGLKTPARRRRAD